MSIRRQVVMGDLKKIMKVEVFQTWRCISLQVDHRSIKGAFVQGNLISSLPSSHGITMVITNTPSVDVLVSAGEHLQAAKYFQVAAYVMLVYDHMITFSEEVERIWKNKITGAAILFLINRYITILQFIVILDATNDPTWTETACRRFVVFPGASTVSLIAVCELIMILRVYALYNRNAYILAFLLALWCTQIITCAMGLHTGHAIELPPGFVGCILTGRSLIAAVWIAPLITNTTMFLLTLYRSRDLAYRNSRSMPILHIFVRDGTIYFLVIFIANLVNTLIYFLAEHDLKTVGASFSQLITSVMISRLVLNLRAASQSDSNGPSEATLSTLLKPPYTGY